MSSDAGQAVELPSADAADPESRVQAPSEPRKSTDCPLLVTEKASGDNEPSENQPMNTPADISQEQEDEALTNGHSNPGATSPTPLMSLSDPPAPSLPDISISSAATVHEESGGDAEATVEHNFDAVDDNGFDDDFDDFDDFGETVEEGDGFDDFGDFDTAAPAAEIESKPVEEIQEPPRLPLLDFAKLSTDDMKTEIESIVFSLYPQDKSSPTVVPAPLPSTNSAFLTERSQSLWTQLCTPPPLQPPNWKLSRIRRLFLVSLGVPVDLDEILPADTKQKKLVLPSSSHIRKSSDVGRGENDRSNRSSSKRRKEKEAQSKLVDIPSARILCSTSDVKLRAFTVSELEDHVKKLEEVTREASETLTYWLGKRETALGDKEAFERVIENLVEFAKKKR
ncbi:hypothetical protein TWF481_001566 [Arthrobotrys musiformis]|uniref:Uncharacterized protein n=1 Tax=Arthrobotrys musiformis TaxID=47236 RepID=A0AAV9VW01_9PEZI